MLKTAEKPNAEKALAGFSFVESSFFPIPPDPLLIAMVLSTPKKWLRLAHITVASSVLGGILGYFIGFALFESAGQWLIDTYHLQTQYNSLGNAFTDYSLVAVLTAAITPIPYKLVTITAGAFAINFPVFIIASIIGRGIRFYTEAFLVKHFGEKHKETIEKYINQFGIGFIVLIIIGFFATKFI